MKNVTQDVNNKVVDYIHPASKNRYNKLNYIAFQIRQNKEKKTKIFNGKNDFILKEKNKDDNTKWSEVPPFIIDVDVEQPDFNVGILTQEDNDIYKKQEKERIENIKKKNEENKKYKAVDDSEEIKKDEERIDKMIEKMNLENDDNDDDECINCMGMERCLKCFDRKQEEAIELMKNLNGQSTPKDMSMDNSENEKVAKVDDSVNFSFTSLE